MLILYAFIKSGQQLKKAKILLMEIEISHLVTASFCILNASIGMYGGYYGAEGFRPIRPIGFLIGILGTGVAFFLLYAQENHGYIAQTNETIISMSFLLIGFLIGKKMRRD